MATTILNESWNVGNVKGSSNNAYTFRLEIIENSQSVESNSTNITVNKYLKGINGWSWYGYRSTDAFSGSVTDSVVYNPSSMSVNVEYLIHSYSTDIAHNSDGTMSISITNTFTPTGGWESMPKANTKSFTVPLTTIPRASVLSLNKTSVNLNTSSGNAISYTITPYSSSFTHKIIWALGSGGDTINNATNGSLTYSQLLNALSSSANGTLSVTLETYSGSTLVGSNSASVPVSVDLTVFKPTLTVGNIAVNTTPVTAATIKTYLIAGITTAKFTSTASKPTGAASVTTTFTTSHSTLSASSTTSTSQQTITTGTLPSSETNNYTLTITVKATDSRGASVTVTKTATVYAYKKPTVTLQAYRVADSTSTTRDDGGSWVYVTFTSTLGATVNGQNSIQSTTCTYTGSISGTATNGTHIALTDSQNATFTVTATDKVSSSNLSVIVPTATYPFDLYYDDNEGLGPVEVGVGLGGLAIPNYIKPYLPIVDVEQNYHVTDTGTDLNDYTEPGIYFFDSSHTPTNIPVGVNGWLMVMKSPSSGAVKQLWFRQGTNETNSFNTYVRQYSASAWSSWVKFITANDTVTNATNADNADAITPQLDTNTTAATRYIPYLTGNSASRIPYVNIGFSMYVREGTDSQDGFAALKLGNTTDSGTAGNKYGLVDIYPKTGAYYGRLTTTGTLTANRTYTLPNSSGTVLIQNAANYVSLWSGSLTASNATATFTYSNYSAYCIVGKPGSDTAFQSVIVPRALIGTSNTLWQIGSGSVYTSFNLKYSSTTVTLTKSNSAGSITAVYGIK